MVVDWGRIRTVERVDGQEKPITFRERRRDRPLPMGGGSRLLLTHPGAKEFPL